MAPCLGARLPLTTYLLMTTKYDQPNGFLSTRGVTFEFNQMERLLLGSESVFISRPHVHHPARYMGVLHPMRNLRHSMLFIADWFLNIFFIVDFLKIKESQYDEGFCVFHKVLSGASTEVRLELMIEDRLNHHDDLLYQDLSIN